MISNNEVVNPIIKTGNEIVEDDNDDDNELPIERIYQTEVDIFYSYNNEKSWYENMMQYIKETPYICPEVFILNFMDNHQHKENILNNYIEPERSFQLNFIERIFVSFQFPYASLFSSIWHYFIRILIIIFIVNSILATTAPFQKTPDTCDNDIECNTSLTICLCPPEPIDTLTQINFICIIVFLVDFTIKNSLCAFVSPRLSEIVPTGWDKENYIKNKDRKIKKLDPNFNKFHCLLLYFISINNFIDFFAVFPFFVSFLPNQLARMMRLFRLIKMMKTATTNNKNFQLLIDSVKRSFDTGIYVIFCVIVLTIFSGWLMHLVEGGIFHVTDDYPNGAFFRTEPDGSLSVSPFASLFNCFYWAAITVTTVGYGDISPVTPGGKLLASCCAFSGVLCLAFPVTLISMNFASASEYNEKQDELVKLKLEVLREKQNNTINTSNNNSLLFLNGIEMTSNKEVKINNIDRINSELIQINEDYNKLIKNFIELKQKSDKEIKELLSIIESNKK